MIIKKPLKEMKFNSNIEHYNHLMEKSTKCGDINDRTGKRIVIYENFFNASECFEIIKSFDEYPTGNSEIGLPTKDNSMKFEMVRKTRDCLVTYIDKNKNTQWYLDKIEHQMTITNDYYWKFDIVDFSQPPRLMTYLEGHHFGDYHADTGPEKTCFRKLTAIVQLTCNNQYEGGEFQLPGEFLPPKAHQQGTLLIFPSYLVHRVSRVILGRRDALVHRAIGPHFK